MNARQIKEAVTGIKFTWDFSIGQLLQIVTVIGSIAVGGIGFTWFWFGIYRDILEEIKTAQEARAKWIPIIEQHEARLPLIERELKAHESMFQNHTEGFRDVRGIINQHGRRLYRVEQDIAVIKAGRGANGMISPN